MPRIRYQAFKFREATLIREAVTAVRDEDLWEASVEREREARAHLAAISRQWDEITPTLTIEDDEEE